MNKVYLLIGGNIGDRLQNLDRAIEHIDNELGVVVQQSAVYETAAWGKTDQQPFLNQALCIETELAPTVLMKKILAIEHGMGRVRMEKNGPRTIDIDILFYNKSIIQEPDLIIPHPALSLRRFVLAPLAEIAGSFVHPVLQKSIALLLAECPDELPVGKIE